MRGVWVQYNQKEILLIATVTSYQVGIRSHLFNTSTKCLCAQFFFIYCSRCLQRVPSGSLASNTCIITSLLSITYTPSLDHTNICVVPYMSHPKCVLTDPFRNLHDALHHDTQVPVGYCYLLRDHMNLLIDYSLRFIY